MVTLLVLLIPSTYFVQSANATSSASLIVSNDAVQILGTGQVSKIITVNLQDLTKNIINADRNVTINLSTSSSGGAFFTQANFSSTVSSITIPKGANGTSFFYKDANAGTPQITISSDGLSDFVTNFVVMPGAPVIDSPLENVFVTVPTPTISGTAAPNSTVMLYDNNTRLGTLIGTAKADTGGAWSIALHLENGTYSFSAASTAGLFTGPVSPVRNFTVDTIHPQLSVTTPDSSAILNTARSIVSGLSSDVTSVKSVTWGVDNQTIKPAYGTTKWSFRTGKLLDGPHVVQINATNSVGLVTTKSIFFISDNIPPTIAITAPANNVILNHINAINGTASDNTLLSQVSMSIDGGAQSAATYSSGFWTAPIISGLSNGIHTITAVAIDAAGNVKTSSLSFTIDNNPPTVSVSYPASNAIINNASPIITGTSSDAETGVESLSATIDGSSQTISGTTNWTMDTSGLSQGSHTLIVTATDEAGNVATLARSFVVDSIPPTLSILAPSSNEILDTTTPTVLGNASGDVPLSSVTWNIDGGPVKTASGTTDWSFTTDKLSTGPHTIQVNATDEAGNVATVTRIFSVDPTKLTLSITSPENNTGVNTDSVLVSGTVTSSSEIPSITWSVDGGAEKPVTGTTNWEFSTGMLSSGIHTIQVSAENTAGTMTRQTIVVTEDTHPPMVAITSPEDNTNLNHILSINGTASDDTAISSVAVSIDGNDTENAIYSKGLWTMPVTLSTGPHNVYVVATDTAGNSVTSPTIHFLLMSNPTPTVSTVLTNNTSNVPTSVLANNTTTIGNTATQNGTQNGGLHFPGSHFEGNGSSFPSGSHRHHHFEGNGSSFSGGNGDGNLPSTNDNQNSDSFQNDNQKNNSPSHDHNQHLSHDTQNGNSHSSQSSNWNSSHENSHSLSSNSHHSSSNNSHHSSSNNSHHSSSNNSHSQSDDSHSSSSNNSHSSSHNSHSENSNSHSSQSNDSHSSSNNSHSENSNSHSSSNNSHSENGNSHSSHSNNSHSENGNSHSSSSENSHSDHGSHSR